jgi:hypothetical protein
VSARYGGSDFPKYTKTMLWLSSGINIQAIHMINDNSFMIFLHIEIEYFITIPLSCLARYYANNMARTGM